MMPRLLPAVVAVAISSSLEAQVNPRRDFAFIAHAITEHYRSGVALAARGDLGGARNEFDSVIAANPTHSSARLRLSVLKDVESGKIPPAAAVHYFKATLHSLESRYHEAIAELDSAIRLSPRYPEMLRFRGRIHIDLGNYGQAFEDFSTALAVDPSNSMVYVNRGSAYMRRGDFQKALLDYDAAIKSDPSNAEAYTNRGALRAAQGLPTQALADFDTAIRLRRGFAPAYLNKARLYEDAGRISDAFQTLTELIASADPEYLALTTEATVMLHALERRPR